MDLDSQYNYIIFGLIINAMALLNLLKDNFGLFICLFLISNYLDLYLIDDKYKKNKQRAQWFKLIATLTIFLKKYKHDIRFDHKVFFFLILMSSSLNTLTQQDIMFFSDQFIILYIILLMFFINYFKN